MAIYTTSDFSCTRSASDFVCHSKWISSVVEFFTNSFFPTTVPTAAAKLYTGRAFRSGKSFTIHNLIVRGACFGSFLIATAKTHNKDLTASGLGRQTQLQYKSIVKKVNELLNTFEQHRLKTNNTFNMGLSNSKGAKITLWGKRIQSTYLFQSNT